MASLDRCNNDKNDEMRKKNKHRTICDSLGPYHDEDEEEEKNESSNVFSWLFYEALDITKHMLGCTFLVITILYIFK